MAVTGADGVHPVATVAVPIAPTAVSYDAAARFATQAAFGPNPGLVQHVQQVGFSTFLTEQLPPFVSRLLIQHLVTSNFSPAYIQRVTRVFEDNGSNVRGEMPSVVRAILLDAEARAETPSLRQPTGSSRTRCSFNCLP